MQASNGKQENITMQNKYEVLVRQTLLVRCHAEYMHVAEIATLVGSAL
jgi:hypothetical protein